MASYQMMKTYVDFAQLDQSRIIQHVQTKHWVNYDASESGVSVDDAMAALKAWWGQGESSCPDSATAQTASLAIPDGLPVFPAPGFVPVAWKLDALGPAFAGSEFQVEVQQLALPTSTTSGAYRLRKPRIATPYAGMSVKGIQLFINGKAPLNAVGWENVDSHVAGHVAAKPLPGDDPFSQAPALSGRHLILLQDAAHGDVLSVSFTGVEFNNAPQCKNLAGFQKTILPVIQQNSCLSCHGGGAPSTFNGSSRLLLSGTDAEICAAALERVNSLHPEASPFYLIGFLNELDHPPSASVPSGLSKDWNAWVATELK